MKLALLNLRRPANATHPGLFTTMVVRQRVVRGESDTLDEMADRAWDALSESISAQFTQTLFPDLPQGKAHFVSEALDRLARAMDTLYPELPDEATERRLARILDRICHLSDTPPTTLAIQLNWLRAWRLEGIRKIAEASAGTEAVPARKSSLNTQQFE